MAAAESRGPRSPAVGRDRWPPDAAAAGWLQPTAPAGVRDCDRRRLRSERRASRRPRAWSRGLVASRLFRGAVDEGGQRLQLLSKEATLSRELRTPQFSVT